MATNLDDITISGYKKYLLDFGGKYANFLAGTQGRKWCIDYQKEYHDSMKMYIAGQNAKLSRVEYYKNLTSEEKENYKTEDLKAIEHRPYILESFYYVDDYTERLLPFFGDFLLDSGAFTFMSGNHSGNIIWEDYVDRYADFIKRNNVQKYFELDIDSVVGYDRVLELRNRLEKETNRPCIPVWHKSRGMKEFERHCDEYSYIAIGGIVSKEIKPNQYSILPHFISEAHKRNTKIHGLGFTSLSWIQKCHFDSVDSTSWTTGNRFGYCYYFDNGTMKKIDAPKGKKLGDPRGVALNNYLEWIKFQIYAEDNL